nr:mind bomb [Hymenolepis microstoma]
METNTPSASIAIPQAPSQPTDNIVWTAPPRNRNQHAHTEVYEDSGIIDSGDRIPLTDAEGGTRPSSVPIQRPRTSGGGSNSNTRTLLSDLFCAGGGGGASAPSEDGIVPSGASSPPVITSRPSTAVRNRTQSGLPPAYRSSALRLRPGAVIQLRLRSMVNENAIATATTPGSEYLSLPSVVERVDDSNGSVVLLIPQTGQRFTLTSSATATCQHQQPTSERMVSRHASANASLLTRMRRRDSYARAAAAAAASTGCEGIATVGETGLVENQQSQETSTQPGNQQDSHESSITRSLLKQSSKQVAEELMFAAAEGNVKKITWLIKHREIDVNTHYAGATALHVACQSGHLNCVDVLLQHGADCRERDADGNQALHAAAQGGALPVLRRIAATLSLLVEREPQPSSSNSTAPQELTLPPDVNARNALRQTPLHLATVGRHLDCARSLLEEFNALPSLQVSLPI